MARAHSGGTSEYLTQSAMMRCALTTAPLPASSARRSGTEGPTRSWLTLSACELLLRLCRVDLQLWADQRDPPGASPSLSSARQPRRRPTSSCEGPLTLSHRTAPLRPALLRRRPHLRRRGTPFLQLPEQRRRRGRQAEVRVGRLNPGFAFLGGDDAGGRRLMTTTRDRTQAVCHLRQRQAGCEADRDRVRRVRGGASPLSTPLGPSAGSAKPC